MMKPIILTILFGLIFSSRLFAQKYSCETSRIGKLITKPLVESGVVNYQKAITDKTDKRNYEADGVGMNSDSVNNTYITRWHFVNDEYINLLFVSNASDKTCTYQITTVSKSKRGNQAYRINGEGQVMDWDTNE